jgi:M6 family metalloprotease-like protein
MIAAVLALVLSQALASDAAVIPLSFSDRAVDPEGLDALFFKDVAAYFKRASSGAFALKGKVFAPLALGLARDRFREADLAAAAALFEAREGEGVLAGYDAAIFVAAGPIGARGGPLWPRQEDLRLGERKVRAVFLAREAGDRAVGIAAHEYFHVLGLKDKYDDPRADVGKWCILGTGYSELTPPPPCADCRAKLGWTTFQDADPRAAAELGIDVRLDKAVRIPLNAEGTEALLLEARDRLFVWHTGGGKAIELTARLEASSRLTPYSEPAFRPRTAGAWSAWITDVAFRDGRCVFRLSPEAPLTPEEAKRKAGVGKRLGD